MTGARAFTLVEVLVCLVLVALLSALAVMSLGGARRAARTADVVGEVLLRDRLARATAERFDRRLELRFDLTSGTVTTAAVADEAGVGEERTLGPGRADATRQRPYALPAAWRLSEVTTATGAAATSGTLAVPCSTGGRTPSYHFTIVDPRGREACTLVVGPTGQYMEVPDATRAHQALAMLLAQQEQRHDAD